MDPAQPILLESRIVSYDGDRIGSWMEMQGKRDGTWDVHIFRHPSHTGPCQFAWYSLSIHIKEDDRHTREDLITMFRCKIKPRGSGYKYDVQPLCFVCRA